MGSKISLTSSKKPFLPEPTSVHTFFTDKVDPKAFLDLFSASTNHFTHSAKAVLNQAVSSYLQDQELADSFAAEYTVEEGFSCLDPI